MADHLLEVAAAASRQAAGERWHATLARTFKRDVTSFSWRANAVLEALGLLSRSWPRKTRIPGRLAFVDDGDDAPTAPAIQDFLARGGTLVVASNAIQQIGAACDLAVSTRSLPEGAVHITGPILEKVPGKKPFHLWADYTARTAKIGGAEVLAKSKHGPVVSRLTRGPGTIVWCAVTAGRGDSTSTDLITPRALALELGLPAERELAGEMPLPREKLLADITMMSVLVETFVQALA
ncbi:MAG: hypothetical protein ABI867_44995 [Kofleriaceae bacterium]